MTGKIRMAAALGLLAVVVVSATSSPAQEAAAEASLSTLWEDMLHYVKVARADLARSYGQKILDSNPDPRALYQLSEETADSMTVLARGSKLEGMGPIIEGIRNLTDKGYELQRTDSDRIAEAIGLLGGTVREYQRGLKLLKESGEFSVPQLIEALRAKGTSDVLRTRIPSALAGIGKDAVRPLSEALQVEDPTVQQVLATVVGDIGYPHAAPRLKELLEKPGLLDRTRDIVSAALTACAGREAVGTPSANLYLQFAEKYYYRADSLLADSRYPTANAWHWSEGRGLTYQPVPREIFCDVYAMRMSRLALQHNPALDAAVPIWLSAYLDREAKLPEGAQDTLVTADTLTAGDFALASSARYLQLVLDRALRDDNSPVAIGAIRALAETTGAANLLAPVGRGQMPLVAALSEPDKHVRYPAALALARAKPQSDFDGSALVVSVLREMLRQRGQKTALVMVADQDKRNEVKDALRTAGYAVIDELETSRAMAAARESAGVDVLVLSSRPAPLGVLSAFREDVTLAGVPAAILSDSTAMRRLADGDRRVVAVASTASAAETTAAVDQAAGRGPGAVMTPEEGSVWAAEAAEAARGLLLSGNKVLNAGRLEGALAALLGDDREEVRTAAAWALAARNTPTAQGAIVSLANDGGAPEAVRVAAYHALTESVRSFGGMLDRAQSQAVLTVVTGKPSPEIRRAASQALGALNLPSEEVKTLIPLAADID